VRGQRCVVNYGWWTKAGRLVASLLSSLQGCSEIIPNATETSFHHRRINAEHQSPEVQITSKDGRLSQKRQEGR